MPCLCGADDCPCCGVDFSDPCPICEQAGYHADRCPEIDGDADQAAADSAHMDGDYGL